MLDQNAAPRALVLPPPYTAHWLAGGDAFAEAQRLAPEHGAGLLVWHLSTGEGRAGRLDFAVVLEPETPLVEARRAFLIGMVALSEAISAHCPPERAVTFGWPGQVLFDGGKLGGMRFASAPVLGEADVPDWMVLGAELIADRNHLAMPGSMPGSVSLEEEGFADPAAIVESFAAYLMLNFDRWTHDGFASVAARYAAAIGPEAAIDESGALVREGSTAPLAEAVTETPWRDAEGPTL
ncbi:biotin/lipoate--protein ligase family protein [Roseovarius aquimarinus]|uniref:Biotin/lipoate--protein ligase family protein n=1 Tax=Roseovarius aquimarinus TaxID=1229156 RepID=A0ABW7I7S1_9RHOB